MKNLLLLALFVSTCVLSSCKLFGGGDDEDCACPAPEICVDGVCQLPEGALRLGNRVFQSSGNIVYYYGVLPERFCVDTLVYQRISDTQHGLHTAQTGGSGVGVGSVVLEDPVDDRHVFGVYYPFCENEEGDEFRATIIAEVHEPDSVNMFLRFFYDDTPGQINFIDSTRLTLVKI